MYKFYILKNEINDATFYYVDMIREAIERTGEQVIITSHLSDIKYNDKVLTITSKAFFIVWIRNPKQYIVNWYQGIVPEEIQLTFRRSITKYVRIIMHRLFEYIALKYSKKNFFVSLAMKNHYMRQYKYKNNNYIIVPCFNQEINKDAFCSKKYSIPSFVYAGSMSEWQCIDRTLDLFKKIKNNIALAKLTILTKEIEYARLLCSKKNIEAEIKYVPLEDLNSVLAQFKYGFIVRDDILVNNVATPTKMNSYMASGIIPIYSDVIHDYSNEISNLKYVIPFISDDDCINKIKAIENTTIYTEDIITIYETVFNRYWSRNHYIDQISVFLR